MPSPNLSHEQPVRAVVIGGGTGNSTVLKGMREITNHGLSAIVNPFDDGGGTGKLREEYDGLPAVGDLRQCLDAMSGLPLESRDILSNRWDKGRGNGEVVLHGQTTGNIVVAAAIRTHYPDLAKGLKAAAAIFNVSGQVLPPTDQNRRLWLTLPNGEVIKGEHTIEERTDIPRLLGSKLSFDNDDTKISDSAAEAIHDADMVILAPGDLYTSIAPVLAVKGMREALYPKPVIQVTNLMNRAHHTKGYTALAYALEYERFLDNQDGRERIIKRVLYNTEQLDPLALAEQKRKSGSSPVRTSTKDLEKHGFTPVGADLLSHRAITLDPNDAIANTRSGIRHDPAKVAHAIMGIWYKNGFANKRGTS